MENISYEQMDYDALEFLWQVFINYRGHVGVDTFCKVGGFQTLGREPSWSSDVFGLQK